MRILLAYSAYGLDIMCVRNRFDCGEAAFILNKNALLLTSQAKESTYGFRVIFSYWFSLLFANIHLERRSKINLI